MGKRSISPFVSPMDSYGAVTGLIGWAGFSYYDAKQEAYRGAQIQAHKSKPQEEKGESKGMIIYLDQDIDSKKEAFLVPAAMGSILAGFVLI